MMMENKRNVCSLEDNSIKRHKSDLSFSSKERKDKVGERISALQQLVSPYGKTDTASVLLEAMQYIQFLQEQVKVLSAPYLQTTPITTHEEELGEYRLRSRGLCLVPMEYTVGVAQTNGADIWAPVKTPQAYFKCAYECFDRRRHQEEISNCVEHCSVPVVKSQQHFENEMAQFQERLNRSLVVCQDKFEAAKLQKIRHEAVNEMERCVHKVIEENLNTLPHIVQRMKTAFNIAN
ncbi:unnamed protein product [Brassica napus]|uniref:(rape) hypothetical protein n=1 Tax=Brassica napus TaxID=3708 RepID=A0A816TCR6_BRANA|nr:unnamed protein product [Brassica napus]